MEPSRGGNGWLQRHIRDVSPALMFIIKGALTVSGGQALLEHGLAVYKLETVRSGFAGAFVLLYIFMNVFDEIKAIVMKRHLTDHGKNPSSGQGYILGVSAFTPQACIESKHYKSCRP